MSAEAAGSRVGIACAGNWVVDRVKIIDRLPGRGMLGTILSETSGTGGSAFNVLVDLALLGVPLPLAGYGLIGRDAAGDFILEHCRQLGIDTSELLRVDQATSYTDVMSEQGTGDRSFCHFRGANALFGPEHVPIERLTCRILHLGYLLLLDRLDEPHPEHGTVAASLLRALRARGIKTSVDVVSEESDRFSRIVPAALPHTDYLIINEIEAGRTTGLPVRDASGRLDAQALVGAVDALLAAGDMELAVVHAPEGAYARARSGIRYARGSLKLPKDFIAGSVGAGDAFCAGVLYALHESWDINEALHLGACAAAACLSHPSSTAGMMPLAKALELGRRFPETAPPVKT